jgi:hypothetical protein
MEITHMESRTPDFVLKDSDLDRIREHAKEFVQYEDILVKKILY